MIMLYLSIQLSANAGLIFSVDDNNINKDDTITVNLFAQDIPNFDEMSLFIEFDTLMFDYNVGSFSSVLDDICLDCFIDATPENYGLNLFFLDFVNEFNTTGLGQFLLASFQLTAKDVGDTAIELKENSIENYFYNSVTSDEYFVESSKQNLSVTAAQVPEPNTILLMAIAFGLMVRRKMV